MGCLQVGFQFLDVHSGAVVALATIVLVIITAVYAVLTWKLAKSAERSARAAEETARITAQRFQADQAIISIAPEGPQASDSWIEHVSDGYFVNVTVRNEGGVPAKRTFLKYQDEHRKDAGDLGPDESRSIRHKVKSSISNARDFRNDLRIRAFYLNPPQDKAFMVEFRGSSQTTEPAREITRKEYDSGEIDDG